MERKRHRNHAWTTVFRPKTLTVKAYGVAFTLPAGWTGGVPDGQEIFVIGKDGFQGFIFLSADETTEQEITATMNAPIPLDEGITLHPKGKAKKQGNKITNSYTVSGVAMEAIGTAIVGPHGVSVYSVAVAAPADLPTAQKTADTIMRSVKLTKPPKPAVAAAPKGNGGAWDTRLRGKRLIRLKTMSGYSERETLDLCANGVFLRHFNAGGVTSTGGGNIRGDKDGKWGISGSALQAVSAEGDNYSWSLTFPDNQLHMNGTRWFIEGPARCN